MTNRTTGIATKWSRRMLCAAAALALMGGSALAQELDQDRLGDLQDRALCGRRDHHAAQRLQALGQGRERGRRHHAQGVSKKLPIEVIEYDDRSNSDEMIKALERLINQDKVDFLFPPWGTAFSLASAPIFARAGYPQILVTATTDRAPEFAKRWPNSFWLLGTATEMAVSVRRGARQAAQRGQDRQHHRDDRRRRPVRHRAVDRGARGLQEGQLQARLRQVLSARHAGHAADPDRGDAQQRRRVHGGELSARHLRRSSIRPRC